MSDNTTLNPDFKDQFEKAMPAFEKIKIGSSPCEIIHVIDEEQWAIVLGNRRVTDWFKTEKDLTEYMENDWLDLNFRLIGTMLEINEQVKEIHKQNQNQ